ncbi:MAG: hypothetical protein LBR17_04755, partial [Bacteroidales bacterium]|nr:hypothetical protein [Bacteroidales bacterium]
MKKISILFTVGLFFAHIAGFGQADLTMLLATNNGTTTSAGTSSNPYKITCARDLDTLSWYVRCGSYRTALNPTQNYQWRCLNKTYFIFTQDIDMSVEQGTDGMERTYNRTARANNFIPIGGRDSLLNVKINDYYCARGYWNGNNKKITNLTITGSNDYTGLFGYTKHVSGS